MLQYGFETLNFETILAATDVPNTASARVLEKLGMALERRAPVHEPDTLFYAIHRDAFTPGTAIYRVLPGSACTTEYRRPPV